MLTQSDLKKQFHYDPETGVSTRIYKNFSTKILIKTNNCGYIHTMINYKSYPCHRLAWLYIHGEFPKDFIDHKNGVRNDNRIENLRECSNWLNQLNTGYQKNNTSGYKGVSYHYPNKKWRVYVSSGKSKRHILGYFNTALEGHLAYENFCKINHGEFYRESISQPVIEQFASKALYNAL